MPMTEHDAGDLRTPAPGDAVQRLASLLHERMPLVIERWEQRVAGDAARVFSRQAGGPALRDEMPAIVGGIAARLATHGHEGGAEPAAEALWASAREEARRLSDADDLRAALGELSHLRAAVFELCEAERVPLSREERCFVHTTLDKAVIALAAALAGEAVAAARRERERLDLTLRLLPVGVFISDAEGRILVINDAARRIWGTGVPQAESAAEYGLYRAYRAGSGAPIAPEEWGLARALQGYEPASEDVEIVSFEGERRMILNSALALRDPDGTITGGVAVNVDVTDRKRTELCLAALLEGALDAVILIDASGHVTEWNAAAERTFGYARAEALGRELAELVMAPAQREAHRRGLRRCVEMGEARIIGRRVEMRAMRADGTTFEVELSVIRLPPGGPADFAGFVRDITDRKRAERELAREAELRERFMGVLGHDLRNPLSAIQLAAESLLRKGPGETQGRNVQRILRSAGRMDRMIRDLLDFTRTRQGGGIPVDPRPADLCAICRHVLDEVEVTHPGRAVDLRAPRDAPGRWDPDRIAQVIQNLVLNALDYSPAGTPVDVTIDDTGWAIVLRVRNEGPPIPADLIPHLFDPFRRGASRVDGPATRGLGLGLYIAHEIVRAHHGRVAVDSGPARGTTFVVELPRRTSAKAA